MNERLIAFMIAVFLLGVLAGALVWIPITIREQERRFEARMRLAQRYRK